MNKIQVTPEGRPGVWLISKIEAIKVIAFYKVRETIPSDENTRIHCLLQGAFLVGADWEQESVIQLINRADHLAVLTGDALISNLGHSLSVIADNRLYMFDIGSITEQMLDVLPVM